jgi:hypothetical protein
VPVFSGMKVSLIRRQKQKIKENGLSPEQLEAALNSLSPCFENRNTKGDKEIASHKLGGEDNRNNEMRTNILIAKRSKNLLLRATVSIWNNMYKSTQKQKARKRGKCMGICLYRWK